MRQLIVLQQYLRARHDERGASAVEYGLLVALIAAIIVGSVLLLGNALDGIFDSTGDCVAAPNSTNCP